MSLAIAKYQQFGAIKKSPILSQLAATSVGIVGGEAMLDLCYEEDSRAEVDMNIVMTGAGRFVELQSTAEKQAFDDGQLAALIALGKKGITELLELQRKALAG